jgi:hypothetical protein
MPAADALLEFFKAMANESRMRIVGLLAERERTGQDLAGLLDLKEPTVSHHLAILKDLGLVDVRAEGAARWHSLRAEAFTDFNRALFDHKPAATPAGTWEFDLLNSLFGDDGLLSRIPRPVILAWLAAHFEPGRDYTEAEVNETLRRRHWDAANIRRELLAEGLLVRRDAVFRRGEEAAQPPPSDARPSVEREEKVLASFVDASGALTLIPAARNKRRVILKWLVELFETDRRYPEKELNAILLKRHWDSATLRREMIGYRMMARENGIYWRLPEEGWAD